MIKYKLTDQKLQTRGGFQWVVGEKQTIAQPGIVMCSDQVFHYYASPEQAVLFNPIHANIEKPRLFEVEIDKEVAFDGLKGGCHEMTLKRELTLPNITIEQKVAFAIRVALKVYSEPNFVRWCKDWLSSRDRSEEAAEAAAWAARAAEKTLGLQQIDFQSVIEEVLNANI